MMIVFCALRNNKGATGGPGGVLYMLSQLLGGCVYGYVCEYRFNTFNQGRWYSLLLNCLFFALKCLLERNRYYVSHDIQSSAILACLRKNYSLIYHNQGPIVRERINFGKVFSPMALRYWQNTERLAFKGARSVHFPSEGASVMYFSDEYATCLKEDINLGQPLYNTIPDEKSKKVSGLEIEADAITFFSLGALTEAKGQDLAIRFIERYIDACPDKNVRYIVVGKGPLTETVCAEGYNLMDSHHNFEFIYFNSLSHGEVMYIHEIADVYLMLHRLSIFDFATLEAMKSNVALVLSPVGGNMDFQKDENVIFAEGDYRDAINRLIGADMEQLKSKNAEVFHKYFSNDAFVKGYRELIRRTIE